MVDATPTATYIKGVSGCLGDTLDQLVGDGGPPLDVRSGSQQMLQHAEGQGLAASRRRGLAHYSRVDQAAGAGQPGLACRPPRDLMFLIRPKRSGTLGVNSPPRY